MFTLLVERLLLRLCCLFDAVETRDRQSVTTALNTQHWSDQTDLGTEQRRANIVITNVTRHTHTHTHASRQTLPRTTCRPINIITADDIQILQLNSRIERWCTDSNSIKQTIMVLQATSNSTAARACPGPQCGRGLTALPQTL